mmetsp:Transcript_26144/g.57584  ORF Transcript_26144/g.57584 Transcript_26144/m.57584 type:complete len:121 (+) Transcript_26144:118-480(+)|eukprot:CAMPEP_0201121048 /NCGR_PEP_ID=MMETSP0850-20130426/5003_1 /ASSEMBLY_ACC=CAM_ASM_000622 /TAXON_ID=183588 /ORGANISM="Pseudo-nitzschia fraudulenta, Strain WWA7" /LENGTH=120 /DNA_ID=CAMNT_0047387379 /DNA_START=105 /DNA_END=467 /DNA_ORIENTATION=-
MIPQLCFNRVVATQLSRVHLYNVQTRVLSTQGVEAFDKLKVALEQYRVQNYAQCIPTRFKKDIVLAAKEAETEHVALEGLEKVILNIGASHKVSRHDIEMIFSEIGVSGRISTDTMLKML